MTTLRKVLNGLNRVAMLGLLVHALHFLHTHRPPGLPPNKEYMGIWKYMTIWTATLHVAFYGMCIICEVFSYMKFKTEKFSFRGLAYHALVFPMGLAVNLHFWLLYIYDRELIYPRVLDKLTPPYYNHVVHTFILPGMLIEGMTYYHPLPPKRKDGLILLTTLQLAYAGLVFTLGIKLDNWVYPFLGLLAMPLRVAFCAVSLVIVSGYYVIGEKIHMLVWRRHLKEM